MQRSFFAVLYVIFLFSLFYFIYQRWMSPDSDNQKTLTFRLEHCNCTRKLNFSGTTSEKYVKLEETTCGIDAFKRGLHQKVVGFSFYGDASSKWLHEK